MTKALEGIRVLDLTRVLAGPWATQLLGDLGAEVLKVEKPGDGDDTRSWGPPYVASADGSARESAYFLSANRGKKSLAIDIADARGAAAVATLAVQSDVLVENFKVGGLERYKLDYATLSKINPRLIYCSITGFGQDGPYSQRPGYDFVIQGMGGLMSVTGEADGDPMKAGVAIIDLFTGLYAANAIQAALIHRERTGLGQFIDLALFDVQVAVMANQALNYLATGRDPARHGNAHPNIVPYQSFATADGSLTLAVGTDGQFGRLCRLAGLEELSGDPRYATNEARVTHRESLIPILAERFRSRATQAWLDLLEAAGVPAGPVNSLSEVFSDPQIHHRGLAIKTSHDSLGSAPGVRCPIRFSAFDSQTLAGAPVLGVDTYKALAAAGLADDAIQDMASAGVIPAAVAP